MRGELNYSGLVIAGIGFFLTRFTVTLALYEDPVRFYLVGIVPLILGLGLAAFGVALVVADVEAALVRTTAVWCVVGAAAMLVLVVLTVLGSTGGRIPEVEVIRSQAYLSTFLIGGSVGGTMTGLYAARTRRQRAELAQQANRLEVLNRMLRHEVLNAVNVIQGYATGGGDDPDDAAEIIRSRSDNIENTIEQVSHLTWTTKTSQPALPGVDLGAHLRASVDELREAHPDARIAVDSIPEDLSVHANDRLGRVFGHLLENAVTYAAGPDPAVDVGVTRTPTSVRVSVTDEGEGLPVAQQALLEDGEITEYDDPRNGYGLNVVRLLVEGYGGTIETEVTDRGTTVTVGLPRSDAGEMAVESSGGLTGVRPSAPHLAVVLGAAVLAGIPYGIVSEQLGGSVAAIGTFYGFNNPVVGWLTHEFHSAVFGFVFAGLVSYAPRRYRDHLAAYVVLGVAWGVALWTVAAGLVAPLWLRVLGFPAPLPSFSPDILASHVVWGLVLGVLTALGYRHVTPWLARVGERLTTRVADARRARH